MGRRIGKPMITTSVRVSPEFHSLCVQHNINFSEAIRVGISLLLAERGVQEYDNSLNLMRRLQRAKDELTIVSQKYHDLKGKKLKIKS